MDRVTGAAPRREAARHRERILPDADQSRRPGEDHQTLGAGRIPAFRPERHPVHPAPGNRPGPNAWDVWASGHPGSLVLEFPESAGIPGRQDQQVCDRKSGGRAESRRPHWPVYPAALLLRRGLPAPCTPGAVRFVA